MPAHELLEEALISLQTNDDYSEAVLTLKDGSRLCFCHRVGERWAKSVGSDAELHRGGVADEILAAIAMFRLNAKHLDVTFADGGCWEKRFR